MPSTTKTDADAPEVPGSPLFQGRQRKTIVVLDMVESVRLIEQEESSVIMRWTDFTRRVRSEILPARRGHLVKSLGDGMMLTFDEPHSAIAAAQDVARIMAEVNRVDGRDKSEREAIALRTGIHLGDVIADDVDIYGQSANLAARITTLAGPDEILVSAAVRDHLTDGLDGHLEDLGLCYLKHVNTPVRVFRVGHAALTGALPSRETYDVSLRPALAVIPFESRAQETSGLAIGELIADGVITQLGRNAGMRIISRLSSRVFRGRNAGPADIGTALGVHYVLSGSYLCVGAKLLLSIELMDARSAQIVWAERISGVVQDLLEKDSELVARISGGASAALRQAEIKRVRVFPPPTLESYSLMLGGINLMHHATQGDFALSQQLLSHVIERHPKTVAARAWLANSYVLGSVTGFGAGLAHDGRLALDLTNRALHIDPENALSLAVQGYVYCHLMGDPDHAMQRLDAALQIDPNEPMAWLFRSVVCAMWGDTAEGVLSSGTAEMISPRDPLAYFFLSVKASTLLADGQLTEAMESAGQSLRLNRQHTPTYRVLFTAQVESGLEQAARATLDALLKLEPGFSLKSYLASGNEQSRTKQQTARALRTLGVSD